LNLSPLSLAVATLSNNQFTGYGINGLAGGNITYATTGNFYGGIRVWTSQVRVRRCTLELSIIKAE
jgi:hypothetical protein